MSIFDNVCERRGTDSVKWCTYPADVIPLYAADMDFPVPEPIRQALRERAEHPFYGYPVECAELREVFRERLQRLYGWEVAPEAILFVTRISEGVCHGLRSGGNQGDGVLIPTPIYAFLRVISGAGFECQQVECPRGGDGRFLFDFERLEAAITPQTRSLFLCNPHNPLGRVYSRAELERLGEICLRHGLTICSDEVYSDLIFARQQHLPIASIDPQIAAHTVTIMGPGKTWNLAGLRCAMAIVPDPALRERFTRAWLAASTEVNVFGYAGSLAAYREGDPWLQELLPYLQSNRDFVCEYVRRNMPGVEVAAPEGTYVAWLDFRGSGIPGNPSEFLLREARVAVNDGPLFGLGGDGRVRLVFGSPRSMLAEALERMQAALRRL
jgi:cysteine-S-conjugate beta-lyase